MTPNEETEHSSDFHLIFDEAPVGLWEQDMSAAREYVEFLKEEIHQPLREHLRDHSEKLREIASRIRTLSVNQRLLEILGAKNQDHLLENLNNVFSKETYDTFCDEVVTFFEAGETSYRSEVEVQTLAGERRTVLFDLNAHNDDWSRVIVSYRDITERKRVQNQLEQSERRLRQLAENINSIFWISDFESGENLYVSSACKTITGRSREYFEEDLRRFIEIIHPEDRQRVEASFERAIEHHFMEPGDYDVEYRIVRPDGSIRWLHDRAFPVENGESGPKRVAGLAEDVTDRKRAEQQLRTSLKETKTLLQEIHHRVKNNMQIVSSLLSLHARKVSDPEARSYFEDCQDRIRTMVMVHEKLYDSESIASLDFEEYVTELIDTLLAGYSTGLRPEVQLELTDDLDLPLDQLIACGIVLNELVTNALEHGFDGSVSNPKIAVTFGQTSDEYRMSFRDNGLGLPESFDPKEDGNLGWELLESLVTFQLGGEYEVSDREGLEVTVSFPGPTEELGFHSGEE